MSERAYRGYIASRPVRGTSYPQRVQNLVVRDYAQRRGLPYRLSVVEYAMPRCTMMLHSLLEELPQLGGAIFFSAFMLPDEARARAQIYARFRDTGTTLHLALENRVVHEPGAFADLERLLRVAHALTATPFGGRYEKDRIAPEARTPTEKALFSLV